MQVERVKAKRNKLLVNPATSNALVKPNSIKSCNSIT